MSKRLTKIKSSEDIAVSLDRALALAYLRTCYQVGSPRLDIRIGMPNTALDLLLEKHGADSWAFLTAWNPGSRMLSPAENAARQSALEKMAQDSGLPFFRGAGIGSDLDWEPEESLLILGLPGDLAADWGRIFGQNALVFGERGGLAELWWIA